MSVTRTVHTTVYTQHSTHHTAHRTPRTAHLVAPLLERNVGVSLADAAIEMLIDGCEVEVDMTGAEEVLIGCL